MLTKGFFKFAFGFAAIVFLSLAAIVAISLYEEGKGGPGDSAPQRIACPDSGENCRAAS